jgi:hypothetical protein
MCLDPLSRIWQAQLPPAAPQRPETPPPKTLDEKWMADRLHQTRHFFDWMADGSLPGGVKFLSKAHGEDTRTKAQELLEKAVCSCAGKMDNEKAGSPVLWAILLAQQAHALQHRWEVADHPERWDVHEMHELLRERQDQYVTQEGGSRAPSDTRAVPRGLGVAQRVRDLPLPPPCTPHPGPHPLPLPPLRAAGRPQQRGCAHAPAPRGRARS